MDRQTLRLVKYIVAQIWVRSLCFVASLRFLGLPRSYSRHVISVQIFTHMVKPSTIKALNSRPSGQLLSRLSPAKPALMRSTRYRLPFRLLPSAPKTVGSFLISPRAGPLLSINSVASFSKKFSVFSFRFSVFQ